MSPAKSKSQQVAAGLALLAKRGKLSKASLRGPAKSMLSMTEAELAEYARTKRKGLPVRVKRKR